MNVLLPVRLHRATKIEAARRGVTVTQLVSEVLAEALHEDDGPPSAA